MSKFSTTVLASCVLLLGSANVRADTMYTSLASWEAAVGTWTETTHLGPADNTIVSGATLADGTALGFSQNLQVETIGIGWATWCCGYTGNVVESYGTGFLNTENWTISPVSGFGMFIEPDNFSLLGITLTLSSGDSVTQAVQGDAGAQFFGWVGSGVTSLTISSSSDFAEGDFFSSKALATPEVSSIALLSTLMLGLLGITLGRKRLGRCG